MVANLSVPKSCPHLCDKDKQKNRKYLQAMERLLVVMQELSLARTLSKIMEVVRVAVQELTVSQGASFLLRDHDYCDDPHDNTIIPKWKGQRFPLNICIGGWVIFNQKPAVIVDISVDKRVPEVAYQPKFVKSMIMVPICTQKPIGTIGTYWGTSHQPTLEEVKILQTLADMTFVAIKNVEFYANLEQTVKNRIVALELELEERKATEAKIHRLSLTDELTSLYNRRGFFIFAERTIKLGHRKEITSYLMFIDLDGLKQINDQFGHESGDIAIVAAANIIKKTFNQSDTIGRLGGDEFVVLFQCYESSVEVMIERLNLYIDEYNQNSNQPFTVSMSTGIVSYNYTNPTSLDRLITVADELMYQQKRAKKKKSFVSLQNNIQSPMI